MKATPHVILTAALGLTCFGLALKLLTQQPSPCIGHRALMEHMKGQVMGFRDSNAVCLHKLRTCEDALTAEALDSEPPLWVAREGTLP